MDAPQATEGAAPAPPTSTARRQSPRRPRSRLQRYAPWYDSGARFSPVKLTVFVLLFVPALYVLAAYPLGWLGARPTTEAIHQIGLWTIRLIFIALSVTPFRQIVQWQRLVVVRRMI